MRRCAERSNRTRTVASLMLAMSCAAPAALGGQATPSRADSIPSHDTLTIVSRALDESRRINVHTPPGYDSATRRRFTVLYMPDGGIDEDFPHVVNTVDSLTAAGRIRPVIIVGIPNTERRRDLTGPTRVAKDSTIAPHVGGSAAFRRFIRDELVPVIEARYRTTDERAIVGESLAGLFIVETLLLEPDLFDRYIALDPSVWWNGGALVDSTAARLTPRWQAPRFVFLASSEEPSTATGTARLERLLSAGRRPGLTVVYAPRPDLTHGTIFRGVGPEALARALRP